MSDGDLWSVLVTNIDPSNTKNMSAVLQSTIHLLETELVKARAALQEIQSNAISPMIRGEELAVGAMAAYRQNLIGRAPDFYYGTSRLTPKDLGLVSVVHEVEIELTDEESVGTAEVDVAKAATLEDLLATSLVLDHLAPYLSTDSLLALSATSHYIHSLILETPYVFRYTDLTDCRGAQLTDQPLVGRQAEHQSLENIYSGPLRGIFANLKRRSILQSVLSYAVRPTRPAGSPRVKGIYYFTSMDRPRTAVRSKYRDWWNSQIARDVTPSIQDQRQNAWYSSSGKLLKRHIEDGWAQTLKKCEGIIAFDATLCRGPRHDHESATQNSEEPQPGTRLLGPAIATVALGPRGCEGCHTSPEGPAIWGQSRNETFPLLSPPPFHSSSLAAAKRPALFPGERPVLIARCTDCLTDRWCHRCNKWFCSSCLPNPEHIRNNLSPHQTAVRGPRPDIRSGVTKDCWECGPTCAACKLDCQRSCQACQGDYCIEHNEGCSSTMCDWCNTSTRHRVRELF
ncbi:hypothetical protein BJX70DRAFT_55887 [Aspergillus crustosus]